jgi:DNA-directed RNA polymerase subunit K/omega
MNKSNYNNYSRGPSLDLEKCVENMGNSRFMMIIIAAARVREIAAKNKHSTRLEHRHPVITALKEVESGELTLADIQKIK